MENLSQAPPEQWYILDVFHQVHGPFPLEDIRRLALRNANFFVMSTHAKEWVSVDNLPHLHADIQPQKLPAKLPRRLKQALDELMGLCKGVISDGIVSPQETLYLNTWLKAHEDVQAFWPANILARRVADILEDGVVTPEEQHDLLYLLSKITGETPKAEDVSTLAIRSPLDMPEPPVTFTKRNFCLSGKFVYGNLAQCTLAVAQKGGACQPSPRDNTHYLVIGSLEQDHWGDSSHARKVKLAQDMKKAGKPLYIISEEHWTANLLSWQ